MSKAKKVVAVFGANRVSRGEPLYDLAEETGRQIAGAGWVVLNGGYGGTMEAAARGARENGGHVIGVPIVFGTAVARHQDRMDTALENS